MSKRRYGSKGRRKPGSLIYFGGAVHEVLADGFKTRVREDLVPGSPKSRWKPKWGVKRRPVKRGRIKTRRFLRKDHPGNRNKNWISQIHLKKGKLRMEMGVPSGRTIPLSRLIRERARRRSQLVTAKRHGYSERTLNHLRSRLASVQFAINAKSFGRNARRT